MSLEQTSDPKLVAAFALELAQSRALSLAVQTHGREPMFIAWSLGYHAGQVEGVKACRDLITGTAP